MTVFQGESIVNKSIYAYDSNGNKLQESISSPDGANLSRTCKYNSAGKIIEQTMTGFSTSYKVERGYDETGNVVEERKFENGSLKSRTINTYDKGKLMKTITLKPDGAELSATTNRYNDAGNLIDSTFTNESRKTTTTISRDDGGRMRVKETFTSYDKNSRSRTSHDPDPGKTIIKFDENGKEVEHIYYNEIGAQSRRWTSSYNDRGKLFESVSYKADGKIEGKVIFEYDLYGNLIKRISWNIMPTGEVRTSVVERRIITYY